MSNWGAFWEQGHILSLEVYVFWYELYDDVEGFTKQFNVCQQAKHEFYHPSVLFYPPPIPDGAWTNISIDFMESLPTSASYKTIFVVVDRFTKVAHFQSLKHPFSADKVARMFLHNGIKLHVVPTTIVSYRDRIFMSNFWQHMFHLVGTKTTASIAYHPQIDG